MKESAWQPCNDGMEAATAAARSGSEDLRRHRSRNRHQLPGFPLLLKDSEPDRAVTLGSDSSMDGPWEANQGWASVIIAVGGGGAG